MDNNQIQNRIREMIMASAHRQTDSGCWIWNRQISNSGYGKIMVPSAFGPVTKSARTASYEAFVGAIPKDFLVVQSCGERLCVNPEHLELKSLNELQRLARNR